MEKIKCPKCGNEDENFNVQETLGWKMYFFEGEYFAENKTCEIESVTCQCGHDVTELFEDVSINFQ